MVCLIIPLFGGLVGGTVQEGESLKGIPVVPEDESRSTRVSSFIENKGQWDDTLLFVGETSFGHIGLGPDCVYYDVQDRTTLLSDRNDVPMPHSIGPSIVPIEDMSGCIFKYTFEGADPVKVRGEDERSEYTNYFIGDDPTRWATNVRSYGRVVYEDLWDGIDMVFYFGEKGPKYDINIGTMARIDDVRIHVEGHSDMTLHGREIVLRGPGSLSLCDSGLLAYEYENKEKEVAVEYTPISEDTFGILLPHWDRKEPVVVDPAIVSTYLGGDSSDNAYSVGADGDGNIILFGWTYSSDFPTVTGSYDLTLGGSGDLFVSKLDGTGSNLIFSTYIGGNGYDYYYYYGGMAMMDDGILVTSISSSTDFPTTAGCYDSTLGGTYDTTFTKLSLNGTKLIYSSYFGGSNYEYIYDVCSSDDGGPCLFGSTYSSDIPTTIDALQGSLTGTVDCFVARFSSDGSTLEASTYFGGSGTDTPQRILSDINGDILITGSTTSSDFPTVPGCYDTTSNGGGDSFVTIIDRDCKSLVASTLLGGSSSDTPHGMATDIAGNVLLFGFTSSNGFPTTSGAYQETYIGGGDAYVTVMDPALTSVISSTFFGGTNDDSPVSIRTDTLGNVVIAGACLSNDMPTTDDAEDRTYNGGQDFFLGMFSSDLSELVYSTYYGGSGQESGGELCIDPLGKILVAGRTNSTNIPVSANAYQEEKSGSSFYVDAFVFGKEHFTVSEPLSVNSVRTYSDENCTMEKKVFDLGERVYIELIGTDSNASRRDGAMVNVSALMGSTPSFQKVLIETEKGSGRFRGSMTVPVDVQYLDTLRVSSKKDISKWSDVLVDYPYRPSLVSTLSIYEDATCYVPINKADLGQTIFFKALGMDSNPMTMDKAFVDLKSDRDPTFSRLVVLLETGVSTGVFIGPFMVPLTMDYFENITARSMETPSRTLVLMVHTPVKLRCDVDNSKAVEDVPYKATFWNFGYNPVTWSVTESAIWLTWDPEGKMLYGTPSNLEVGQTEVTVSIWDEEGHSDEWTFRIDVANVPPRVLTDNSITALEDEVYFVRYESDDDPGGRTSWFLTTNANFLSLNKNTGTLSGSPINEDVGTYFVSIEVQDGNGGTTNIRFNLTVLNTNDRPWITTADIKTVMQDERLVRDYDAIDEDLNDTHHWELRTDAEWLTMDNLTGVMTAEPKAWDVGYHDVNVTVMDSGGLKDSHEFRLEVLDKKDKPYFIDRPSDTEIVHGHHFRFDVNASDPDVDDEIEYSISKCDPPSDLTIDPDTGMIDWVASIHFLTGGKDRYRVTLKVSDGELFSTVDFDLKVVPTLSPTSTLLSPLDGRRTPSSYSLLQWTGEDPEDNPMTYTVFLHPSKDLVIGRSKEARFAENLTVTYLNSTGLVQGTTYHWSVVPYDGCTYGQCTSGTGSFRVNSRPVIEQMGTITLSVGKAKRAVIRGEDPDQDDVLVYRLINPPEGMTIDSATGSYAWTPSDAQEGEWNIKVRVGDGLETVDMSFKVIVERGEGLDPMVVIVIAGFSILILIIVALVIFIVLRVRKIAPDEKDKKKVDDADQIAKEIEELRTERDWEKDHTTGETSANAVTIEVESPPPVPTSPMEAHLHDKGHVKPTYEDLYGMKMPEESEEQMDKVLEEGLQEMVEEEEEESWE